MRDTPDWLRQMVRYESPVNHIVAMESLCRGGLRVINRASVSRSDPTVARMERVDRLLVRRNWIDPSSVILCVPEGTVSSRLDCLPTMCDAVIPVDHNGASIVQADRMSRLIQSCFRESPDAVLVLVQSGMVMPVTRADLGV